VLTEELPRDYLERFMKHVEVDEVEYAKQGFVEVFQLDRNVLSPELRPNATNLQRRSQLFT
jgi:hypothetical protein